MDPWGKPKKKIKAGKAFGSDGIPPESLNTVI